MNSPNTFVGSVAQGTVVLVVPGLRVGQELEHGSLIIDLPGSLYRKDELVLTTVLTTTQVNTSEHRRQVIA